MRKMIAGLAGLLTLMAVSLQANAVIVNVDAYANSTSGGTGLNTGVNVTAGDLLWIMADPNDCWSAGSGNRITNADGLVSTGLSSCQAAAWTTGVWTQGGLTAPYASLVGSLDAGSTFFLIGTSFSDYATASGLLTLYFFDSNFADNFGSIEVSITNHGRTVPEPGIISLLGAALVGMAALRRRRTSVRQPVQR